MRTSKRRLSGSLKSFIGIGGMVLSCRKGKVPLRGTFAFLATCPACILMLFWLENHHNTTMHAFLTGCLLLSCTFAETKAYHVEDSEDLAILALQVQQSFKRKLSSPSSEHDSHYIARCFTANSLLSVSVDCPYAEHVDMTGFFRLSAPPRPASLMGSGA